MMRPSIALALASGGVHCAYQVGAMHFLAKQGIRFDAIAGSGIGALNAAFYTQGDGSEEHMKQLIKHWRTIPDVGIYQVSKDVFLAGMKVLLSWDKVSTFEVLSDFASGKYTLLNPEPVMQLLNTWIDYEKICQSPVALTVTALNEISPIFDMVTSPWRTAQHYHAQDLGPDRVKEILFASVAIPILFPSRQVESEENRLAYAGFVDPLPAKSLYQDGARQIVAIFLSNETPLNRADFPGCPILEIRPSEPLNTSLVSSLSFTLQTIDHLIKLGYKDAEKAYSAADDLFQNVRRTMEAIDLTEELVKDLNEWNIRLDDRGVD